MLVALRGAYGCYSSVAPVPKIDPGVTDSGPGIEPPPPDSGCAERKPWEGPGVTGVLPISGNTALVLSGDLYFTAEFDTGAADASDPSLGQLVAWREAGALADLWADAPPSFGQLPWENPGVTAVYISKTSGAQVIISRFRRWVRIDEEWTAAGSVVDDFLVNDAGPPAIDGSIPWEGNGITATYFAPNGASFFVISQDKGWQRTTSDPDPQNWTWTDAGFLLAETAPWQTAPLVGGRRPYEGQGVTAAYYVGGKLFVISVDRMWAHDGKTWVSSGMLASMSGWSGAPSAACKR